MDVYIPISMCIRVLILCLSLCVTKFLPNFQLPHLKNFSIVVFVSLLGYGVFITSVLFPSHDFKSWSTILLMIIRPYLLLFAETGIDGFQRMYQISV